MKPKPIIFSTVMVQAIIDGRKTQTRRLVGKKKPYQVGDILWVRENFTPIKSNEDEEMLVQYEDGVKLWRELPNLYAIDEGYGAGGYYESMNWGKKKPSIHMPFGAHRLELEVLEVRRQQLHEISEEDAIAEGLKTVPILFHKTGKRGVGYVNYELDGYYFHNPIKSFQSLWWAIYGNCVGSTEVYAYTFKVVKQ